MTVQNFVRIVWRVFDEKWPFFDHFGLISAMFLTSQSYDFDTIAHAGALWAKNDYGKFVKIVL